MAQIRVQNLHKAFADFVAVKDSTFTVRDGEFFCLLGPSGCGKTTTLRMIAGLELPTTGQIFLGDEDVTFKRASHRDIAFVFQLFALYPHLNVRRNIAFPLVGSSNPAIMRSVVVLPQPEGPSRQKNSPSRTVKVESCTATKSANALCRFSTRIWAMTTSGTSRRR